LNDINKSKNNRKQEVHAASTCIFVVAGKEKQKQPNTSGTGELFCTHLAFTEGLMSQTFSAQEEFTATGTAIKSF
jgi:hypothetical protein